MDIEERFYALVLTKRVAKRRCPKCGMVRTFTPENRVCSQCEISIATYGKRAEYSL